MKDEDRFDDDLPDGEAPVTAPELGEARSLARALEGGSPAGLPLPRELEAADMLRASATPPPLDPAVSAAIRERLVKQATRPRGLFGRLKALLAFPGGARILVPGAVIAVLMFLVFRAPDSPGLRLPGEASPDPLQLVQVVDTGPRRLPRVFRRPPVVTGARMPWLLQMVASRRSSGSEPRERAPRARPVTGPQPQLVLALLATRE